MPCYRKKYREPWFSTFFDDFNGYNLDQHKLHFQHMKVETHFLSKIYFFPCNTFSQFIWYNIFQVFIFQSIFVETEKYLRQGDRGIDGADN